MRFVPGIKSVGPGCLPGTSIKRVVPRLDTCLDDNGKKPIVIFSAGRNYLYKVRSKEPLGSFHRI